MERKTASRRYWRRQIPAPRLGFGFDSETDHPGWIDQYRPDAYHWKNDTRWIFTRTGPRKARLISAIDYLHAYWLFRAHGLDTNPLVQKAHGGVL